MGYENFTTYTVEEPDDRIQVTANHIDFYYKRTEIAYVYKDKGVDHFGDFKHFVDVRSDYASLNVLPAIWGVANVTKGLDAMWSGSDSNIYVQMNRGGATTKYITIYFRDNPSFDWDAWNGAQANTWYYLIIKRVGTTVTVKIYSTKADRDGDTGSNLLDTLSITADTTKYRYIYACNGFADFATATTSETDIDNLDLVPHEDFTDPSWIEVDEGTDDIQFTMNHVDFFSKRTQEDYFYKDFGVDYFGDFVHHLDVKPFASGSAHGGWATVWMLADAVDDMKGLVDASETFIYVTFYRSTSTGSPMRIFLGEYVGGVQVNGDTSDGRSLDTWYYLSIIKSGTSVIIKVYSTAELRTEGGVADIDTLSITLSANHTLRYLYVANNYHDDYSAQFNVDIEKLKLIDEILFGVTRDANGNRLGNCILWLFRTVDKSFVKQTISDGDGNYSFTGIGIGPYFIRASKDGTPNLFGVTDDNLTSG